jgi:spermidine/putrescine transport system ATP-binding protein
MALGDRIAVMAEGRIAQIGTPRQIYDEPADAFVADFIGTVNLFEGDLVVDEPDHAIVRSPGLETEIYLDHGVTGARGATVWAAIRPEKIELRKRPEGSTAPVMDDAPAGFNAVPGIIRHEVYLGSESVYEVEITGGRKIRVLRSNLTRWDQEDFVLGEAVWLSWHACSAAVLLS